MRSMTSLLAGERGADATEYALLASFIAIAIIVGANSLGTALGGFYSAVPNKVPTPAP